MKCLIIAAGRGSRLSCRGPSKPLVPLLGMPLIERTIRTAVRSGLTDLYVVTGYQGEMVRSFLDELSQKMNVRITPVINEDWQEGNGLSVLKAAHLLEGDFVLLMADHVFDEEILKRLLCEPLGNADVRLAVDYDLATNGRADPDDVTNVLANGGRILKIGKQISRYNAYDAGIFLCSPALFKAIKTCIRAYDDTSLSGAVQLLADRGRVAAFDIQGRFWMDVDDEAALFKAENELLSNLSTKAADGWVSRHINRPLSSRLLTPLLLKLCSAITPNQISVLSFVVAVLSSACFFAGEAIAGAVAMQLSSILDGCDGEVARLKHLQSKMGDYFDAVLDRYADSLMFAGLSFYALSELGGREVIGLAWNPVAIFAIAVMAIVGHLMVSYTSAKSVVNLNHKYTGKWIAAGRGRDGRLFLLFGCGLATWFHPGFALLGVALIAVHTNLIVIWRMLFSWRQTKGHGVSQRQDSAYRPVTSATGTGVKAVVFDFDGTVADTMPFLTELATELITRNYSIKAARVRSRYLETSGLPFADQLEEMFPKHKRNAEVAEQFEARKSKGIFAQPLFRDAIPTLSYLKRKGINTFVCSSTRVELVEEYAARSGLQDQVDGVFGYKAGFDKGRQITAILQDHGLKPEEVVFVGDSKKDGEFARAKRLKFIRVCRDFTLPLSKKEGTASVESLEALINLFEIMSQLASRLKEMTPTTLRPTTQPVSIGSSDS